MSLYRIHLLFEPWASIEMRGKQISLPPYLGYGHVYCLLEKNGAVTKKDFVGLREDGLDCAPVQKTGLAGFFNDLMRMARLRIETEENIIVLADEEEPIASFDIDAYTYEKALKRFRTLHGTEVSYDRIVNNCVSMAKADLEAAGISVGNHLGLTAGQFFRKVYRKSKGNLLAPPLGITVIERTPQNGP